MISEDDETEKSENDYDMVYQFRDKVEKYIKENMTKDTVFENYLIVYTNLTGKNNNCGPQVYLNRNKLLNLHEKKLKFCKLQENISTTGRSNLSCGVNASKYSTPKHNAINTPDDVDESSSAEDSDENIETEESENDSDDDTSSRTESIQIIGEVIVGKKRTMLLVQLKNGEFVRLMTKTELESKYPRKVNKKK